MDQIGFPVYRLEELRKNGVVKIKGKEYRLDAYRSFMGTVENAKHISEGFVRGMKEGSSQFIENIKGKEYRLDDMALGIKKGRKDRKKGTIDNFKG